MSILRAQVPLRPHIVRDESGRLFLGYALQQGLCFADRLPSSAISRVESTEDGQIRRAGRRLLLTF